jgi:hypothetical protein
MGRSLAALQSSLIAGTSFNHTRSLIGWGPAIDIPMYRTI